MLAKLHQSVIKNQMGKMGFGMSCHFQNVVIFQNVKGFMSGFFPFSKKTHNCKQKFVNKNL